MSIPDLIGVHVLAPTLERLLTSSTGELRAGEVTPVRASA